MSRNPRDLIERIEERLSATGKSAEGAARAAGLSRDYIRNLRTGKSSSPKADKLERLAAQLETNVSYLLNESDDPTPASFRDATLPILFEAAAGQWAPVDELAQEPLGEISVTGLDRFPFRQWVERVKGDSFDRRIPDGALVHVVDAVEMGYVPRHRDVVIVTRTERQGSFVERTMKQVEMTTDGQILLTPQSHNPRWQDPLAISGNSDDTTIRIVGKVLRAYIDL